MTDIQVYGIKFSGKNNQYLDVKYSKERECYYRFPWKNDPIIAQPLEWNSDSDFDSKKKSSNSLLKTPVSKLTIRMAEAKFDKRYKYYQLVVVKFSMTG